jgi:hypothetical protein
MHQMTQQHDMSYWLVKTLQYRVTRVQAFAAPGTPATNSFPLRIGACGDFESGRMRCCRNRHIDTPSLANRMKKVPPGGGTFRFGPAHAVETIVAL